MQRNHFHPMRAYPAIAILLLSVVCSASRIAAAGLEPVSVQLKWTHQFQFAGYYMAKEKGYYADGGLDVRFIEGGATVDVVERVLAGEAEFGVGTSELLLDYAAGKPVVVLGVVYQHSPLALAMKTHDASASLEDLVGQSIVMEKDAADLLAMLKYQGLRLDQFTILEHPGDRDGFATNNFAAMSCYLTDEPYMLREKGIPHLVFSPRAYGIDFYGDTFFTTQAMLKTRRDVVEAFRTATIRGWEDALAHPDEAVDLILAKHSPQKSRDHLLFEARMTERLMTRLVHPGFMLKERWEHMAETYVEAGMLDSVPALDGFIHDPEQHKPGGILLDLSPFLLGGLVALLFLLFYMRYKNMALQKELVERTAETLRQQADEAQRRTMLKRLLLRDIHDGLGALVLNLSTMSVLAMRESEEQMRIGWLEKMEQTSAEASAEIRNLMNYLESSTISWGQIIDSIRRAADTFLERRNIKVAFHIRDIPRDQTSGITEGLSLVRMVNECIDNIIKHAEATEVDFIIRISEHMLQIEISDNGRGYDPATVSRGRGLDNLENRADELGGRFSISVLGKTVQCITLPLPLQIVKPIEDLPAVRP